MKKIMLSVFAVLFTVTLASARDIITTDLERLPQNVRNFIDTHFPNDKVSYIKIDEELMDTEYEVVFENGNEIEFNRNGEWRKVEVRSNGVPAAVIPANIQQYVNQNFSGTQIREIKKKKRTYDVELTNRLELEFDMNGNFRRIDD